jgi:chaperonin GroEL
VAYEQIMRNRTPELLSDAGTLARRIIQISDGTADVGAMLMRQAVWQVGDRVGDGSAITAVLTQSILHNAYRSVAASANAMRVRTGIQRAVAAAVESIKAQATPVTTQAELTGIARSYCHYDDLARLLGEVYSIVGAGGYVEVQSSNGRKLEREYVEGSFWRNTGWISSAFAGTTMRRSELQDVAVMMVDGRIEDVQALGQAVGAVLAAGHKSIVIVCLGMSEAVISVLAHNHVKGVFQCLPVRTPASNVDRKYMFDDMAVMLGGEVLAVGDKADMTLFRPEMVGRARRFWADTNQFGFIAGKGSPKALREHIATLRKSLSKAKDKDEMSALRKRLGRLMGGTAVINVGAPTEAEQKLQALTSDDPDVCAGIGAVISALEEPMRVIAANAGDSPSTVIARARRAGPGYGLNAYTHEIEDMRSAGIVDSANVAEQVLITSGSVASMVLTTDVVVRHRKPDTATTP